MQLQLVSLCSKMPGWVSEGFSSYQKRLPGSLSLKTLDIPLQKRAKGADIDKILRKESKAMLAAVGAAHHVVALDVEGQLMNTYELAGALTSWQSKGQPVSLLIGGPEGLSKECLARADQRWSLSPLTLPHPMVRIVVAEQLYRAWTLQQGHPYHK